MTADEYREQILQAAGALRTAFVLLEGVDLAALREQLERADSVGPILDPTAWIRANQNGQLRAQRDLIEWARVTRAAGAALRETARHGADEGRAG